jgi:hypothetical protein
LLLAASGAVFLFEQVKILEIIVAPENQFDIFRAPFDRNECDGILAKKI